MWDDLEYKEYSYNELTKDLPLKIFEAPPPYGKRIVTINIETEGSDKVSVICARRIYEYRDRFQAKEIPRGFPGSGDGEEKGKYCRVMKSVDVSEEAEVEKVWVGNDKNTVTSFIRFLGRRLNINARIVSSC